MSFNCIFNFKNFLFYCWCQLTKFLFNFIKKKLWSYITQDIKSLLTKKLERFYLLFEDLGEFFKNNLYIILYNKKNYNTFMCKILLSN